MKKTNLRYLGFLLLLSGSFQTVIGEDSAPRIECDPAMIKRARERTVNQIEPFHTYWQLAKAEAIAALERSPKPCAGVDSLEFHGKAQEDGMAARLLAYRWRRV